MKKPLDELYFDWLCKLVGTYDGFEGRSHARLLKMMYEKEFVWVVPMDENRIGDGKFLRREFNDVHHISDPDPIWMSMGCSFLEMLVGVAYRLQFQADRTMPYWFWHMLGNIRLTRYYDSKFRVRAAADEVNAVLEQVIWRTYAPDGRGSLFPIRMPEHDMRELQIWDQLQTYIQEPGRRG